MCSARYYLEKSTLIDLRWCGQDMDSIRLSIDVVGTTHAVDRVDRLVRVSISVCIRKELKVGGYHVGQASQSSSGREVVLQ